MNINSMMSDKAILTELGYRLSHRRVELELTQADLSREAGVSKRTVERIEAGEPTQTSTLIRVLRVLDLLESFNMAIPANEPRPMDLLKLRGQERQRVSSKKHKERPDAEWSWSDET